MLKKEWVYLYSHSGSSSAILRRTFIHALISTKPSAPCELIRGYGDIIGLYVGLYSAVSCPRRSRGSSVPSVTSLRARTRGIVFEFREVGEGLSRFQSVQTDYEPTQPPDQSVQGTVSRRQRGCEVKLATFKI